MSHAAGIELKGIRKSFSSKEVLRGLDFRAEPREFIVFVGPSGCGKSTALRCIAGLETVTGGQIEIGGHDVTHLEPRDRDIAMVFQDYALYPHMSVYDNIAFGLKVRKFPRAEIAKRVQDAAQRLELMPYLERRPAALSGGQRQRVAIGRAIVRNPKVFLFDEPLSNLDAKLRGQMRLTIAKLHKELDATIVYVTHDQIEAMTLADRIVVLEQGKIRQVGKPLDLYYHPLNTFVATFIGSPPMNLLDGVLTSIGNRLTFKSIHGLEFTIPEPYQAQVRSHCKENQKLIWGVRPENLAVAEGGGQFQGRVVVTEPLGPTTAVYADFAGHELQVSLSAPLRPKRGEVLSFDFKSKHLYLFDKDTGNTVLK